jgi:hypothetical protein
MPYRSLKQAAYMHANMGKKRGLTGKVIKEFDNASRGMDLPKTAPKRKFKYKPKKS